MNIFSTFLAVQAGLRRRFLVPAQPMDQNRDIEPQAQVPRQKFGLVEAPPKPAGAVQRHWNDDVRERCVRMSDTVNQLVSQQLATGHAAPELEMLHQLIHRILINQGCQGLIPCRGPVQTGPANHEIGVQPGKRTLPACMNRPWQFCEASRT